MDEELKELKAQAYDCLAQIQQWQKKLEELNQRIAILSREERDGKTNGSD